MKKYLLKITFVLIGVLSSTTLLAQIANQPPNLQICDDTNNGFAVFDLTITESDIIGGKTQHFFL